MACIDGECTCPEQFTACGGECVSVEYNPLHCGACGARCEGTGMSCIEGECRCGAELTLCDAACVNTDSDPRHCGVCGVSCTSPARCQMGECL